MNTFEYIVESLAGDYANLIRLEDGVATSEQKLVARALLPPEVNEGDYLLYEWLQYSIIK